MSPRTVNLVAVVNSMARRAVVLVAITVAMTAQAQEEKTGDAENATLLDLLKPGANLIYKDPETNKVTPLPAFTREMLEDVLKRARLQGAVRLIDLVELKITGEEKSNGFAYLTVELQIRVHAENERVGVDVGFNEFTLRDRIEHVCETPNSWASLETDKLPAKSWILFGKGLHRLTFDLIGQVRATTNGQQRIRIDTLVTPLSSLLLKFHETVESAQLTNGNPADVREGSTPGTSELQTWGLADQTEIVWTPKPADESRKVSVRSTAPAKMTLDLTTDPGSLMIKQPLVISGGSVDHLEVKLPKKFSQVSISGTDADGTSIIPSFHKVDEDSWLIQFSDPITGPITLDYDLGLEKQSYPQDISVKLPTISNSTNETGDIELFVPIGLDVKVNRPDEKNTRRIRVESAKGMRTAVVAYRLLSAEARLDLTISETEAFFSVVPQISFETERDEILQRNTLFLTARFKINIARGSLNKMDLKWPNYVSDGWQVVSGDATRLITESGSKPITGFSPRESPDTFTVVFPERQSGQFEIELQAFRDLQSVQAGNGILFLPDIVSPTPHTTTVSLIESDADSIVLSRPGADSSFPALPSSRWPKVLKESKKPLSAWLVDSPNEPVQIKITPQKEEVRVRVMTALSIVNDSISVNQIISYDVRHKDHGEIRLVLPDVTPTVRLKGTSEDLSRTKSPTEEAVFSLPTAKRGKFDITVDYFWSPSTADIANNERTIRVPIAMPFSTGKQFETLTVATNAPESLLLVSSPDWERIHSDDYSAAWQSAKATTGVPVMLQHALEYAPSSVLYLEFA